MFIVFWLLIFSAILLVDVIYSITYFEYTYFLELKRRFSMIGKGLPVEYRQQLQLEVNNEVGGFRRFIQSAYVPWFILCFFINLWFLPLIITGLIALTNNLFYRRPYISPAMLFINLFIMACSYGYSIGYLILTYLR